MTSAEVWKSWEGRTVGGKFLLKEWIGGSDHSAVFLTEFPDDKSQRAAVKLIPADAGDADRQLVRWHAAAQLSHPNLIRIIETGQCGPTLLYMVMEFAEDDLSQVLPQRPLSGSEIGEMLPPVLEGLTYLHAKGFVHGRLKPSNVQAAGDRIKLSPDHIASSSDADEVRRRRDVFDPPESAAGIFSPAGDLWSLGVTLVAAFTQDPALAEKAERGDSIPLTNVPDPFREIVTGCLHLDPQQRWSIGRIRAKLQPSPPPAVTPAPVEDLPTETPRKRWPLTAAGLAIVAVVVIALFYWYGRYTAPSQAPPTSADQSASQSTPSQSAPAAQSTPAQSTPAPTAPPAPSSESTTKPTSARGEVVHQALPEISASARKTITGTIKIGVRVEVSPEGKVTAAKLINAGPSKYFARLSLEAAERWQFSAPQNGGQPTASAWMIRFHLRRTSTQAFPEQLRR